jgi:hypothetical protein
MAIGTAAGAAMTRLSAGGIARWLDLALGMSLIVFGLHLLWMHVKLSRCLRLLEVKQGCTRGRPKGGTYRGMLGALRATTPLRPVRSVRTGLFNIERMKTSRRTVEAHSSTRQAPRSAASLASPQTSRS